MPRPVARETGLQVGLAASRGCKSEAEGQTVQFFLKHWCIHMLTVLKPPSRGLRPPPFPRGEWFPIPIFFPLAVFLGVFPPQAFTPFSPGHTTAPPARSLAAFCLGNSLTRPPSPSPRRCFPQSLTCNAFIISSLPFSSQLLLLASPLQFVASSVCVCVPAAPLLCSSPSSPLRSAAATFTSHGFVSRREEMTERPTPVAGSVGPPLGYVCPD